MVGDGLALVVNPELNFLGVICELKGGDPFLRTAFHNAGICRAVWVEGAGTGW
jgi:hypothetical protein